jgi:hypothetical protein
MSKKVKLYIAILVIIFIAKIYIDLSKPKPIDWRPTYSLKDKIPLGMYVFDKEMPSIFKNQKITKFNTTAYEYLADKYYENDSIDKGFEIKGTYLNISEYSNTDDQSISDICNWVSYGNTAFISSKFINESLLDSLNVEMNGEFDINDSIYNWVANKKLGNEKFKLIENVGNNFFSKIDTLNTTVLGYQSGDSTRINFVKVPWVNGNFYLHTQPAAFTNFHLLKKDHFQYAEKVLSYIPKGDIIWETKGQNGEVIDESPLRFIFSKPALYWAYYIALIGMLFFIIFNAKRKQRIVPIIEPLRNTSIDFTKTIGNLYLQEGNHDDIINKKIIYFLEKIRNEYLLDTTKLDADFIKKLQQKSGKNTVDIQEVVNKINDYRKSPHTSIEQDLIAINNAIEKVIG